MILRCFFVNVIAFLLAIFSFFGIGRVIAGKPGFITVSNKMESSLFGNSVEALSDKFEKAPIFFVGDNVTRYANGNIALNGRAEITRYNNSIKADEIFYESLKGFVQAHGNVRINVHGNVFFGPYAAYKIEVGQGYVVRADYRLKGGYAGGQAKKIEILGYGKNRVIEGTYSTCDCNNPDWYLYVKCLDLDQNKGVATAKKSVLYFKNIPIFVLPHVTFPVSKERMSGFLPPHVNFDTRNGFDIEFPVYFNLASNYDLLFRPRILQKHGIQWGANYRFLTLYSSGVLAAEVLPLDRILKKRNRYSFSLKYKQEIFSDWYAHINIQHVSDSSYALDLANSNDMLQFGTDSLIRRESYFTYNRAPWNILFRAQNWQYFDANGAIPYSRWPEINVQYFRSNIFGFYFDMKANITNFQTRMVNSPTGNRSFIEAFISYPSFGRAYFIIPALHTRFVSYNLKIPVLYSRSALANRSFSFLVPTISLDAGLTFERQIEIIGYKFLQTLEPHLFYAYTPYIDQSFAPIFDTGVRDLDISSMFSSSNYVGYDRINDGNRIAFGLQSKFLQSDNGKQIMKFVVAQRHYIQGQRTLIPGESFLMNGKSDVLFSGFININPHFLFQTSMHFRIETQKVLNRKIGVVWSPIDHKVVNFVYRSFRVNESYSNGGKIRQAIASAQWVLGKNTYGVGRINYSLQSKRVVDAVLGFQYDKPCWTFGLSLQRYASGSMLNMRNVDMRTRVMVQLNLKGLANINNGLSNVFRSSVPGYLPPVLLTQSSPRFAN